MRLKLKQIKNGERPSGEDCPVENLTGCGGQEGEIEDYIAFKQTLGTKYKGIQEDAFYFCIQNPVFSPLASADEKDIQKFLNEEVESIRKYLSFKIREEELKLVGACFHVTTIDTTDPNIIKVSN